MSDRATARTTTLGTPGSACVLPEVESLPARSDAGRVTFASTATGPLIDAKTGDRLWAMVGVSIERVKLSAAERRHLDLWAAYGKSRNLPPAWRGRTDLYHYELLICGFKRLFPSDPEAGRGPRVRRAGWLRRALRDQQRDATAWFKALDAATRRELANSYRFEDAAQRAESRYIARINREHRSDLERLRSR